MIAHTTTAAAPPRVVRAQVIAAVPHTLGRGTRVPVKDLGEVTLIAPGFSAGRPTFGTALAFVNGADYPAQTTDGGSVWTINGPALFTDTADAPLAIGPIRFATPKLQFSTGGGGNVIDVTSDGGRVWRRAGFNGVPVAVVPVLNAKQQAIVAYVQTDSNLTHVTTLQYVSRDGGRTWRYSTALGGVS